MNTPLTIFLHRLLLSCLGLFAVLTAVQAQVIPHPADSFVESIGVNVHLGYAGEVYDTKFDALEDRLEELGIRHIRDGADAFLGKPRVADRINKLYTELGIHTTFITGRREGGYPKPITLSLIDQELEDLRTKFDSGLIAGIEGPNEYNEERNRVGEDNWITKVKDYQQKVYDKVNAAPDLKDIPVIGPSFTTEEAYKDVGNLDDRIDFTCIHLYQSWRNPGTVGWGDNGYGSITWNLKYQAARQSPSRKPVQSTECGYHNVLSGDGVPEDIQAKYLPRTLAEFYRRGIYRSFKYELVDQGSSSSSNPQRRYGLLRNDLSPKPVFYAVKGLINLLADPGEPFPTKPLDYSVEGSKTENVHELLLQKRDGTYYLLIWLEVEGYQGDQEVETPYDPRPVTVRLPSSINRAQLHRQGLDGKMTNKALTIENKTVKLDVYDRMQVLELSGPTDSNPTPTASMVPEADAFVRAGFYQDENYGTEPILAVKNIEPDFNRQSFLRFDVSTLKANAKVSLTLTVVSLGGENATIRPIELWTLDDDTWGEQEVTWATKPALGRRLTTFNVTETDIRQQITLDVSDYVNAERASDGTVSLALVQTKDEKALTNFGARESTTPPTLNAEAGEVADISFPDPNQWYFIQNRDCEEDGLRLETDGCTVGGIIPGRAEDKHWQFVPVGDYYMLRNKQCPDRWLELDGQQVGLRDGGIAEDVQWRLVKTGDYFFLQNRANGKRLDSDECSTVDANNQGTDIDKQWRLIPVNDTNARSIATADKVLNPLPDLTTELTLYPNPVSNQLTVDINSSKVQTTEVSVLFLSGQMVQQRSVPIKAGHNSIKMDVSMLTPGVYLLQVRAPYGHYKTQKLIIE